MAGSEGHLPDIPEPQRGAEPHRGEERYPGSDSRSHIRVSDQERDRVIAQLNENAGVGRLTLDELEERIEAALSAKTGADLEVLTRDLPVAQDGHTPEPAPREPARRKARRWLVAIMGGSTVRGRFRAADRITSVSVMGGDDVDLREAEIEGSELVINAFSLMGGSSFYLPDSVDVSVEGFALMGGNDERGSTRRPRPGAPLVRIRSFALMGGTEVWRLPAEARGMRLREAKRMAKAAEKGRLPGKGDPHRLGH